MAGFDKWAKKTELKFTRAIVTLAVIGLPLAMVAGCTVSPEPMSKTDIDHFATASLSSVTENQEEIAGQIDLYEVMARALKYNLDYKVEVMEAALRIKKLDLAHYKLLPDLVANSGYAGRSNFSGSNSRRLADKGLFQNKGDLGAENVAVSTGQDRDILSTDLTFSWNILDFGLSYVRARQAADEVLIAQQLKRKVINRIIEDVRTAYWRAVSYQRLIKTLRRLDDQVRQALADTRAGYEDQETSAITLLTYERELVEIRRELQRLEGDLNTSKAQLAALMNLRPGTKFSLIKGKRRRNALRLKVTLPVMISKALRNRPELREAQYRLRINDKESEAALFELLPGLQTYAGLNNDSNSFLFNQSWLSWGAKASWNLLSVFQYPARKNVIAAQEDLLKERAKALTMAIMTQVYISRVQFLHKSKELRTAGQYFDIQRRLFSQIRAETAAHRISEQTLIREQMNTLVADVKYDIAYADLHNAYASVFASMGLDPYNGDALDTTLSVKALAKSLRKLALERGDHSAQLRVASN